MNSFYERFSHNDAELIELYSRLIFELRENRNQLLNRYQAEGGHEIIEKISSHELSEHPAYEDYLSAAILAEVRDEARSDLAALLKEVKLS